MIYQLIPIEKTRILSISLSFAFREPKIGLIPTHLNIRQSTNSHKQQSNNPRIKMLNSGVMGYHPIRVASGAKGLVAGAINPELLPQLSYIQLPAPSKVAAPNSGRFLAIG